MEITVEKAAIIYGNNGIMEIKEIIDIIYGNNGRKSSDNLWE